MARRGHVIDVADFFCGCGGTSTGLRAAGMEIALGLDFDRDAGKTFRRNFPEAFFIDRNIVTVSPEEVEKLLEARSGPLLVSACAPCQPYSSFVKRPVRDERRTLLLRLLPFIELLEPEFVFIENVPGLKSEEAPAGTFARFCKALRGVGYDVSSAVVDCQAYGVPQRRRRLVILASRLGPIDVPPPTHGRGPDVLPVSTVWEWIGDLPPLGHGETHPDVPNHVSSALTELNLRRIRATPPGGGRLDWPSELRLTCHEDHRGHSDVYGRMASDAPAPVLTTKCTSISNGRFGHPFADRPISVREAACIQTFPLDFVFEGGIKSSTRQVGNAVPVLLAQRMGEAFVRHLAEHRATA
ncbi:MAG: (cytosine-5)-methyltransferase 1 [Solirubrobacteraceae bacterium]|jgi:DNA (cytosine-5)-methyltransferase 1|nr:(cytosine-5)-methyltransferase 1 [Solirubrobacteraceae bacterium]